MLSMKKIIVILLVLTLVFALVPTVANAIGIPTRSPVEQCVVPRTPPPKCPDTPTPPPTDTPTPPPTDTPTPPPTDTPTVEPTPTFEPTPTLVITPSPTNSPPPKYKSTPVPEPVLRCKFYTVIGVYDGIADYENVMMVPAKVGQVVTVSDIDFANFKKVGYEFNHIDHLSLIVADNPEDNVIFIYYFSK